MISGASAASTSAASRGFRVGGQGEPPPNSSERGVGNPDMGAALNPDALSFTPLDARSRAQGSPFTVKGGGNPVRGLDPHATSFTPPDARHRQLLTALPAPVSPLSGPPERGNGEQPSSSPNNPAVQELVAQRINQVRSANKDLLKLENLGLCLLPIGNIEQCRNVKTVSLRNNCFQRVPQFSCQFAQRITSLDLSDNGIGSAEGIEAFINLERLGISGCKLRELILSNLPYLQEIDVRKNNLTRLILENLPRLIGLYADGNALQAMPRIENCPQLSYISLSDNQIENTDGIEKAANVQYLDLHSNKITRSDFTSLKEIREIYLGNNNIPEGLKFHKLSKCSLLDLSTNKLTQSFLNALGSSRWLKKLDINTNCTLSMDGDLLMKVLEKLPVLEELYCQGYRLKKANFRHQRLKTANASSSQVQSVDISQNPRLTELFVSDNELGDDSVSVMLKNAHHSTDLKMLFLRNTNLTKIPDPLDKFRSMQSLNLDRNNITSITGINKLNQLEFLRLSNNKIQVADLAELASLKKIWLNDNQLTQAPTFSSDACILMVRLDKNIITSIDKLIYYRIEEINVEDNRIENLGEKTNGTSFPKLQTLNVRRNPLNRASLANTGSFRRDHVEVIMSEQ